MKFVKDRKCYKYNLFFFKNLVKPFKLILLAWFVKIYPIKHIFIYYLVISKKCLSKALFGQTLRQGRMKMVISHIT